MTRLYGSTLRLPAAAVGPLNPLPDLASGPDLHGEIRSDESVTAEEKRYMGYARVQGILPYLLQDGYGRDRESADIPCVVLENDRLKALFVPRWGGRLWSLFDKEAGQELLHRNPVFQPCNLALRNAWISGGVEWNCGIIGHSPFTVDQVFAEALTFRDGTPALRLYEYERVRGIAWRVEAFLPEGSAFLFVRVRMDNTRETPTACYWWSNMAVDEAEDRRVVVPARRCYRYGYGGLLSKVSVPVMELRAEGLKGETRKLALKAGGALRVDTSYAARVPQAMDFFYDIPEARRPFIAVLDGSGYGLVQTSTRGQMGRKLFVWGMNRGGRQWQRFLSLEGSRYLEVQAGLAKTQLEHLPMEPYQSLGWLEAYGALRADGKAVHGDDYSLAAETAQEALEAALPAAALDRLFESVARELDAEGTPAETLAMGSAFAAVEKRLCGEAFRAGNLRFPAKPGEAERFWWLLAGGSRPGDEEMPGPLEEPLSYQRSPQWLALLRERCAADGWRHWYPHYQLGVLEAVNGYSDRARTAFERSLSLAGNPWSLRCLALLSRREGRIPEALAGYEEALGLLPHPAIAVEALRCLTQEGFPERALALLDRLPESLKNIGRVRLLWAEALVDAGQSEMAAEILTGGIVVPDIREGETTLSDLWYRLRKNQEERRLGRPLTGREEEELLGEALPPGLDFRMQ